MPFLNFVYSTNSLLALIIAWIIYANFRNRPQYRPLCLFNIFFSLWNFGFYKATSSYSSFEAIYWYRISNTSLILITPIFLHFVSFYSDKTLFRPKSILRLYFLFGIFLFASILMPNYFISAVKTSHIFKFYFIPGPIYNVFTTIFLSFLIYGFFALIWAPKLHLKFQKNQKRWLCVGLLLGLLAPISSIPLAFGLNLYPFGILCIFPYFIILTYSIIKFYVFELNILINKLVSIGVFVVSVILIHSVLFYILFNTIKLNYFIASTISGNIVLIILLIITRFSKFFKLDKLTEFLIYKKWQNYQRFLKEFHTEGTKIVNLKEMLEYICNLLVEFIKETKLSIYLLQKDRQYFRLSAFREIDDIIKEKYNLISYANPIIDALKLGQILFKSEIKDKELVNELNKRQTEICIPLFSSRELIGILNIGRKESLFNQENIEILNTIARQLGIFIEKIQLYKESITDDLSGLYRYNYFYLRLQEEVDRAQRYLIPLTLLIIDVDDFKKVNDTYGHLVGDKVITKIASLIRTSTRSVDIIARYGGDEFIALLPQTSKEDGLIVGENIRKIIQEEFSSKEITAPLLNKTIKAVKPEDFKITVSIGISTYQHFRFGDKQYDFIREADQALYNAKLKGKNKICES